MNECRYAETTGIFELSFSPRCSDLRFEQPRANLVTVSLIFASQKTNIRITRTLVIILLFGLSGSLRLCLLQFLPEHMKELYLLFMGQDREIGHERKRGERELATVDRADFYVEKGIEGPTPSASYSCSDLLANQFSSATDLHVKSRVRLF